MMKKLCAFVRRFLFNEDPQPEKESVELDPELLKAEYNMKMELRMLEEKMKREMWEIEWKYSAEKMLVEYEYEQFRKGKTDTGRTVYGHGNSTAKEA